MSSTAKLFMMAVASGCVGGSACRHTFSARRRSSSARVRSPANQTRQHEEMTFGNNQVPSELRLFTRQQRELVAAHGGVPAHVQRAQVLCCLRVLACRQQKSSFVRLLIPTGACVRGWQRMPAQIQ